MSEINNVMTTERKYRSRLNEIPIEVRMLLGEIPYQIKWNASKRKAYALQILQSFKIPHIEIGTGTNRLIVKYDGFAMKIALDQEGIADNKQEWVMSERLAPDVAKAYECSKGGHFLLAHYCPAFTSMSEMHVYYNTILRILTKWSENYLLGDVGINKNNFANWGLMGGRPVCIDYAYIFPAELNLFKCVCGCENLNIASREFSSYKCPNCGHEYNDREIRGRITTDTRMDLFDSRPRVEMTKPTELKQIEIIDKSRSNDIDIMNSVLNGHKLFMGQSTPNFEIN